MKSNMHTPNMTLQNPNKLNQEMFEPISHTKGVF